MSTVAVLRSTQRLEKWLPLVPVTVALVVGLLSLQRPAVWYDSIHYAQVSQSLLHGQGLRTPVMHPWDQPDSSGSVPFTAYAPGLPILYAILGGVGPERAWPGVALNLLGHMLAAGAAYVIARRLAGVGPGLAAGLATAGAYGLVTMDSVLMAENIAIGTLMLSLMLLVVCRHAHHRAGWEIAVGLAAMSAFAMRYTNVALVPVLVWEVIVCWRCFGWRRAGRSGLLMLGPVLGLVALLWGRNYLIHGTIRGMEAPDMGRTLFDVLPLVLEATLNQFSIWWALGVRTLAVLGFLGLSALLWLTYALRLGELRDLTARGLDLVAGLGLAYFLILSQAIAGSEMFAEPRYCFPLGPILIVLAAVLVHQGWRGLGNLGYRRAGTALSLILLAGLAVYFIGSSAQRVREDRATRHIKSRMDNVEANQTVAWARAHLPAGAVASNWAFEINYLTNRPTLNLPSRAWNKKWQIPADMTAWLQARMTMAGADYLILVAGSEGLSQENYGPVVARLSRREPVAPLELVHQTSDGVVYRLRRNEAR